MQQYHIKRSNLRGAVHIPSSKSHTMRALVFAALAEGRSTISNLLDAPDTRYMLKACEMLGAKWSICENIVTIDGTNCNLSIVEDVIYAGNSGIILRFISAIAGLSPSYTVITGDHSIRHHRPMKTLLDALNQLGVEAISTRGDGMAPLVIKGGWKGGSATLSGEDSQFVSSLLIAASFAEKPTELNVKNSGELPFIDMTLSWLDRFGIKYINENYQRYVIEGKNRIKGFTYEIPGDWSSAAFPIAAALVTKSEITLTGLNFKDIQGDKEIINALRSMGANIDVTENFITVKPSQLKGQTIDVNSFIDSVTILAVIGCFAEGETCLVNAGVARYKESDRLKCITLELNKMGADIIEKSDGLLIKKGMLHGAVVESYDDHRMAMSLSIAALNADGETLVKNTACIAKTYPNFHAMLLSIGANIEVKQ